LRPGGVFLSSGTVGQHDAAGIRSGGAFILRSGFWYASFASIDVLFFDGFEERTTLGMERAGAASGGEVARYSVGRDSDTAKPEFDLGFDRAVAARGVNAIGR